MATIEVSGKSYETDEEGYLINLAEWNEDVGSYLAQTESSIPAEFRRHARSLWDKASHSGRRSADGY